jgi:hypothetical protein
VTTRHPHPNNRLDAPGRRAYFGRRVEDDGTALIKIGCSIDPAARCHSLRAELLASEPGGIPRERELHLLFARAHVHGEWFAPDAELLAYIDRLQAAA